MIEVHPRLWVGNGVDAEQLPILGWASVAAAKEPFHRKMVGYKEKGAPVGPEQYQARRGRHLALNWVDVDNPDWFRPSEFWEAMEHINAAQRMEIDCLVHCNQGESRGPTLALGYLCLFVEEYKGIPFDVAEEMFLKVYPTYNPKVGVRSFVEVVVGGIYE